MSDDATKKVEIESVPYAPLFCRYLIIFSGFLHYFFNEKTTLWGGSISPFYFLITAVYRA